MRIYISLMKGILLEVEKQHEWLDESSEGKKPKDIGQDLPDYSKGNQYKRIYKDI